MFKKLKQTLINYLFLEEESKNPPKDPKKVEQEDTNIVLPIQIDNFNIKIKDSSENQSEQEHKENKIKSIFDRNRKNDTRPVFSKTIKEDNYEFESIISPIYGKKDDKNKVNIKHSSNSKNNNKKMDFKLVSPVYGYKELVDEKKKIKEDKNKIKEETLEDILEI